MTPKELPAIEPVTVTIKDAERLTGEGRSTIYLAIGRGEIEAVKSGSRTLIIFESLKRRVAAMPRIGRDLQMTVPTSLKRDTA
jgi:excisionase family DNA binding protein